MGRVVTFNLAGMTFEYDEEKNQKNIEKHGLSFKTAARIFWDYNRIEFFDENHSTGEERYNTIGDVSVTRFSKNNVIIIGSFKFTKKLMKFSLSCIQKDIKQNLMVLGWMLFG